jgi:hypothetical protein
MRLIGSAPSAPQGVWFVKTTRRSIFFLAGVATIAAQPAHG